MAGTAICSTRKRRGKPIMRGKKGGEGTRTEGGMRIVIIGIGVIPPRAGGPSHEGHIGRNTMGERELEIGMEIETRIGIGTEKGAETYQEESVTGLGGSMIFGLAVNSRPIVCFCSLRPTRCAILVGIMYLLGLSILRTVNLSSKVNHAHDKMGQG
jgi:hypothetical protein